MKERLVAARSSARRLLDAAADEVQAAILRRRRMAPALVPVRVAQRPPVRRPAR